MVPLSHFSGDLTSFISIVLAFSQLYGSPHLVRYTSLSTVEYVTQNNFSVWTKKLLTLFPRTIFEIKLTSLCQMTLHSPRRTCFLSCAAQSRSLLGVFDTL